MQKNFYLKLIAIAVILAFQSQSLFAQKGFFSPTPANARMDISLSKHIEKYSLYRLKVGDLRSYLLQAPLEFKSPGSSGLALEVPLPDGKTETFSIFESPTLSAAVAAKYPEIKTYTGRGTTHGEYSIRVSLTSIGFNAMILGVDGETVYFDKVNTDVTDNLYRNYFIRDAQSPQKSGSGLNNGRCGTLDNDKRVKPSTENKANQRTAATSTGTTLRIFRLVMAADAEYTANKGGKIAAFAALVSYVNNMRGVYTQELSIDFTLVSDVTIVYEDALTDPYNNDDQSLMLTQNQTNMDLIYGNAGYDIGHVLGYAGGSGGGIATSSVCETGFKAWGTSGVGDGSFSDVFDQQLIQHEVGHQFSMSHSYNSNVPVCTTRTYNTSVEPGSGTTIMSYGYTCFNSNAADGLVGNDDYENTYRPILNFHSVNFDQANNYLASLPLVNGNPAFASTPVTNTIPVISVPSTLYTIPMSTPFALTGSATDPGDVLSFSWEGTNLSDVLDKNLLTTATLSDLSKPPFFRSYSPVFLSVSNPNPGTRLFPRLSSILDGSNYAKGDKLPSVGITTTHRLVVRDNHGGVSYQDVSVIVVDNAGPFLITNDLTGTKLAGSLQTITWSVNNTNLAPVNCTLVDIFLSTDGGLTFPATPLLASALNIGTAIVTLPAGLNTQTARIKIAAGSSQGIPTARTSNTLAGTNTPNIFFDISNLDFIISTTPLPVTLASFDVKSAGVNDALLKWETTSETNNSGFDIEMSSNATQFSKVGYVEGKGDSQVSHLYNYTLSNLAGGLYYFRLKQLDFDGKFDYSTIKALVIRSADDVVSIYPNPGNGKMKINPGMHENDAFSIQILNEKGQKVMTLPSGKQYGNGYELDASFLGSGLYFIKLQGGNFVENLKFVKY